LARSKFYKTEYAHQDAIFRHKGLEPTNYGADVGKGRDESWIGSKLNDGRYLHTHHNHKTGKITHTWSGPPVKEDTLDELSKPLLKRYTKKANSDVFLRSAEDDDRDVYHGGSNLHKVNNRLVGIKKAKSRMKEETELDERDHNNKEKKDEFIKKIGRDGKRINDTKAKRAGRKMTKEEEDLLEISKATLERYRHKAKARYRAKGGINKELEDKDKEDRKKAANEELNIIDAIMVADEIPLDLFTDDFEDRLNAIVDDIKDDLKKELFNFSEGHSINQLKQAQISHAFFKGYHEKTGDKSKAKRHLQAERKARELRWKKEDDTKKEQGK
jgi:hypothetical protein